MPTARARLEWRNRVVAEYTSAATAARVVHLAIAWGAPREVVRLANRIVTDELDHAELSDEVRRGLGDDDSWSIDAGYLLRAPSPDGPLADFVDEVFPAFCLGETLAVPLFAAMRSRTRHPPAVQALTRILQDEAVHRRFGWEALDAALVVDPDGVRARVTMSWPVWERSFRTAYRDICQPGFMESPLSIEELEAGLLPLADYVSVYDLAMQAAILPRLAERGLGLLRPA